MGVVLGVGVGVGVGVLVCGCIAWCTISRMTIVTVSLIEVVV